MQQSLNKANHTLIPCRQILSYFWPPSIYNLPMRHLPNLLTLANLFCGCCAIAVVLSAQNFSVTADYQNFIEIPAIEQPYLGTFFIFAAALFDLFDGAAARALRVDSPIGKDLDSLADVVSFGVAPAMILYKMLWTAYAQQPEALDVSIWMTAPAFLVALFAALRLARFNVSPSNPSGFTGMPAPAAGLAIAALPLVPFWGPEFVAGWLLNPYVLYLLIAILCFLMVSQRPFFKLMSGIKNPAKAWPSYVVLIGTAVALPLLKAGALLAGVLLYALLAYLAPPPRSTEEPQLS